MKRSLGDVVKIDLHRGFGFIRTEAGIEYFFHATAVDTTGGIDGLQIGDAVTFRAESTAKGPRALQVRLELEEGEGDG
jgi:cold shock CspA family protein